MYLKRNRINFTFLVIIMGRIKHHPTADDVAGESAQLVYALVDIVGDGIGLVDIVKNNLKFVGHNLVSPDLLCSPFVDVIIF